MSRSSKSRYAKIGVVLIKIVWPFFIKHIWPHIQEQVIEIMKKIITSMSGKFKDIVERRTQFREQEARIKAEEADQRATETSSQIEVAKYQAEAAVWRQVAENLRQDNIRLQEELSAAIHTTSAQAAKEVRDISLEMDKGGYNLELETTLYNYRHHQTRANTYETMLGGPNRE
jgi:hypothetical protein